MKRMWTAILRLRRPIPKSNKGKRQATLEGGKRPMPIFDQDMLIGGVTSSPGSTDSDDSDSSNDISNQHHNLRPRHHEPYYNVSVLAAPRQHVKGKTSFAEPLPTYRGPQLISFRRSPPTVGFKFLKPSTYPDRVDIFIQLSPKCIHLQDWLDLVTRKQSRLRTIHGRPRNSFAYTGHRAVNNIAHEVDFDVRLALVVVVTCEPVATQGFLQEVERFTELWSIKDLRRKGLPLSTCFRCYLELSTTLAMVLAKMIEYCTRVEGWNTVSYIVSKHPSRYKTGISQHEVQSQP